MYESRGDIRQADTAGVLMRWDLGPYSCTNFMISVSSLGRRSFFQTYDSHSRAEIGHLPPYRLLAVTLFATPPRSEAPRTSLYLWIRNVPSATEMVGDSRLTGMGGYME